MTTYFNTLLDYQRKIHWKGNDIAIFSDLYGSVKRMGLEMVAFHDHLTGEFIDTYSTDKIRFRYYTPEGDPLNARFECFYEYLKTAPDGKYLLLDSFDTEIIKDPEELLDGLIIGSEETTIGESTWVKGWFKRAYGEIIYGEEQLLNPGILGGPRVDLLMVLGDFVEELAGIKNYRLVDMAIFNKIMRGVKYKTGYPIHSPFGKYREKGYIRHK